MTLGLSGTSPEHPLGVMLAELEAATAQALGAPAWSLSPNELLRMLPRLATVMNQLAAFQVGMLREADRHSVGDANGAASTPGWWASVTRTTKPQAHRLVALGQRLDDEAHIATREAACRGDVSLDQAAVIIDAVEALPRDLVDPALRADAERHLVGLAGNHDPKDLRVLGRKILDVLAPQIAEEHERRVLEGEEHHAAATASFTMRPNGLGSMVGRFTIPELAGAILAKHLNAIAAPRHRHASGPGTGEQVLRPLRLGSAFVEYVETRAASGTPKAGGLAATIVVTMTLADLLGADKAATLDTGEAISASEARRLACESGLVPAVLAGAGQPLDVGRMRRFHTEPQRLALLLRDRGCAEVHCDWPPGMCHAHHRIPWSRGGGTSVDGGILLCPRHHSLAHDSRYQLKSDSSGRVTFSRRC